MNACLICGKPARKKFCSMACRYADMKIHPMKPTPAGIARMAASKRGKKQTAEHRAKNAAAQIGRSAGARNPMWKGGTYRAKKGYVMVLVDGVYRNRSHIVWEQAHPSEPILSSEVIHHINHITDDDRPENLMKLSRSGHMHEHDFGHHPGANRLPPPVQHWTPEQRRVMSERMKVLRAKRFWSSRRKDST